VAGAGACWISAEAALHNLVQQAPQMLPLAGSPRLTLLGRDVRLGSGFADLIAVESTGRLVVIEVKLAGNAESRRAVVAQVLSYAGYLQGLDAEQLESQILAGHLASGGSVLAAAQASDQQHGIDPEAFRSGLATSLAEGGFRLVIVLDSAPEELVQVVGYLRAERHSGSRSGAETEIRQGNTTRDVTEQLLETLTQAYREAATVTSR
jgi:hypothetical protein